VRVGEEHFPRHRDDAFIVVIADRADNAELSIRIRADRAAVHVNQGVGEANLAIRSFDLWRCGRRVADQPRRQDHAIDESTASLIQYVVACLNVGQRSRFAAVECDACGERPHFEAQTDSVQSSPAGRRRALWAYRHPATISSSSYSKGPHPTSHSF
jgi:hypothetical protein